MANILQQLYDRNDAEDFNALLNETYMCAAYIPATKVTKKEVFSFVIKHPELEGVDFLTSLAIPRHKHLSVNTLAPQ